MELEENKISISTIKQYLQLIIHDLGKFTHLEFLTLKGWLLYSLSLVTILCIPCMAILIITGGPTDRNLIDSLHIYFTSDIDIDFYQQL